MARRFLGAALLVGEEVGELVKQFEVGDGLVVEAVQPVEGRGKLGEISVVAAEALPGSRGSRVPATEGFDLDGIGGALEETDIGEGKAVVAACVGLGS